MLTSRIPFVWFVVIVVPMATVLNARSKAPANSEMSFIITFSLPTPLLVLNVPSPMIFAKVAVDELEPLFQSRAGIAPSSTSSTGTMNLVLRAK